MDTSPLHSSWEEEVDNIAIPLKSLFEEYQCPICFRTISEASMTPCGHNFCKKCISECLNVRHSCPTCNAPTVMQQLVKNLQFDRVVQIISREKDIASRRYFEGLIKEGFKDGESSSSAGGNRGDPFSRLSPIEVIFHKHMKHSLAMHENYHGELVRKFGAAKETVKSDYVRRMEAVNEPFAHRGSAAAPAADVQNRDLQVAVLAAACEQKLKQLDDGLAESSRLLTESYDRYLQAIAPAPAILPVTVTLAVPSKSLVFKNFVLKTTDNANDVRSWLQAKLKESGNPATAFTAENLLSIKRPFGDETIVSDELVPLIQYQIAPGSQLLLLGDVQLQSDLPKTCFASRFSKDERLKCDYYTCKDCKLNWVCTACAETCHSTCNISEYIINHTPTWPCCYCQKSKKCKLAAGGV